MGLALLCWTLAGAILIVAVVFWILGWNQKSLNKLSRILS